MLSSEANTEPSMINLECLKKFASKVESELKKEQGSSPTPSEPNEFLKNACLLTTRVIYQHENGVKGVMNSNDYFEPGTHTEQDLLKYVKDKSSGYRKEIFKQCGSFKSDEEANQAYYDEFDLTGHKFNFYLYSHLSPCKRCLDEIKSFAVSKKASTIGIVKLLVSFYQVYESTTMEQIQSLPDKIEFWVTETNLENLKQKQSGTENQL